MVYVFGLSWHLFASEKSQWKRLHRDVLFACSMFIPSERQIKRDELMQKMIGSISQKTYNEKPHKANRPVVGWSSCKHSVTSSASVFTSTQFTPMYINDKYRNKRIICTLSKVVIRLEAKDVFTKHKPHASRQKCQKCLFCSWWPWPSRFSERGTKHIFCVNLAQICSAVPEIFHTQTKITNWRHQKQNLKLMQKCS